MQAECSKCGEWSNVRWCAELPPGGYWWEKTPACPNCGYIALVESECNFREVIDEDK